MTFLTETIERGGPAVIAIMALSLILYARCADLLLSLRRAGFRAYASHLPPARRLEELQLAQAALRDDFRQKRLALGAMITAAPLLGLLGTVGGMIKTFGSLSDQTGQKSMDGLASGISEVLVATESGLAVAIPAMLLVYLAHRRMIKCLAELGGQVETLRGGRLP
jgi:biopolymer transport protein ExbB